MADRWVDGRLHHRPERRGRSGTSPKQQQNPETSGGVAIVGRGQAGQRLPAAEKALATVFGEDTQAVVENLTRPRADERRPEEAPGSKVAPPAKPDIEEVPRTGMGESI